MNVATDRRSPELRLKIQTVALRGWRTQNALRTVSRACGHVNGNGDKDEMVLGCTEGYGGVSVWGNDVIGRAEGIANWTNHDGSGAVASVQPRTCTCIS